MYIIQNHQSAVIQSQMGKCTISSATKYYELNVSQWRLESIKQKILYFSTLFFHLITAKARKTKIWTKQTLKSSAMQQISFIDIYRLQYSSYKMLKNFLFSISSVLGICNIFSNDFQFKYFDLWNQVGWTSYLSRI